MGYSKRKRENGNDCSDYGERAKSEGGEKKEISAKYLKLNVWQWQQQRGSLSSSSFTLAVMQSYHAMYIKRFQGYNKKKNVEHKARSIPPVGQAFTHSLSNSLHRCDVE